MTTTVKGTALTPAGTSGTATTVAGTSTAEAEERKYRRALEKERERDAEAAIEAMGTERHLEQLLQTANTNAGML
jgi:hypothetical protein